MDIMETITPALQLLAKQLDNEYVQAVVFALAVLLAAVQVAWPAAKFAAKGAVLVGKLPLLLVPKADPLVAAIRDALLSETLTFSVTTTPADSDLGVPRREARLTAGNLEVTGPARDADHFRDLAQILCVGRDVLPDLTPGEGAKALALVRVAARRCLERDRLRRRQESLARVTGPAPRYSGPLRPADVANLSKLDLSKIDTYLAAAKVREGKKGGAA